MKRKTRHYLICIILVGAIFFLLTSCKTKTVYIPIDSVKTEYKDRLQLDSVRLYDSIYVRESNDTIRIERYKYLYRDKVIRDSVFVTDLVQVPYPIIEYKEVNKLSTFQLFQMWCGRIGLALLLLLAIFKFIRAK